MRSQPATNRTVPFPRNTRPTLRAHIYSNQTYFNIGHLPYLGPAMAVSSLRIGIETEFLLRAHEKQDQCKSTLKEFADALVRHYNAKVRDRPGRTEMRMAFDTWHASEDPASFGYWSVVEEVSIDPDEDHCEQPCYFSKNRPCETSWAPSNSQKSKPRLAFPLTYVNSRGSRVCIPNHTL